MVIENFVNDKFEQGILDLIPKKRINTNQRNHILRFGSKKPYTDNFISENIPNFIYESVNFDFNSVTINEYFEGQKIDWHIDNINTGDVIRIVSLLNDSYLDFRKNSEHNKIFLPRFSLFEMSGELRYDWQHSFVANKHRVSVVFRKYIFLK